jgi:hypothetical protein
VKPSPDEAFNIMPQISFAGTQAVQYLCSGFCWY